MNGIKRIASFEIDHTKLVPGLYVSRIDGDITTYDMRMRRPNADDYLSDVAMHTFEHMLATFIRSGPLGADIIYAGPMGCRTGFYLLVRNADNCAVWQELRRVMQCIIDHEGEVFGQSEIECGNYRCLELGSAKTEARLYLEVLGAVCPDFKYAK